MILAFLRAISDRVKALMASVGVYNEAEVTAVVVVISVILALVISLMLEVGGG